MTINSIQNFRLQDFFVNLRHHYVPHTQKNSRHNQEPFSLIKTGHILKQIHHLRSLFSILLFLPLFLNAQDIHFSQYYNSPLTLSPALTGITKGDIRFIGTYRSQWSSALAPYSTFHGAADWKYFNPKLKTGFFSAGAVLNYDDAGDSNLRTTQFGISGAFTYAIGSENFLTLGAIVGFGQQAFNMDGLTWDNQFDGSVFNANRDSRENFDRSSYFYPDFSVGLNWHGQKTNTRSRLNVGMALYHFNKPKQSFEETDDIKLPSRLSLYFLPVIQLTDRVDFIIHSMAQLQGPDFEALAGGAAKIHLNTKRAREVAVQVGVGYRFNEFGDAFIPGVELHYRNWMAGLTYDLNVSGFTEATNRKGGPEVNFRYLIQKVRPLKVFKNCPLI